MQPPNFTLENNFKTARKTTAFPPEDTNRTASALSVYDVALAYVYRECFQRPIASPVTRTILNVTVKLTVHTKV